MSDIQNTDKKQRRFAAWRLILLSGGITALLAVSLASSYLHNALKKVALEEWPKQNQQLLQSFADRLNNNIIHIGKQTEFVASLPAFAELPHSNQISLSTNGIPHAADKQKRTILSSIQNNNPLLSVIFLLTPDGDHYLAQPYSVQQSLKKFNLSDRNYFQTVQKTQKTVISDSFPGADGRLAFVVDTPILAKDGTITAHLGAVVYLDRLTRLLTTISTGPFDQLYLVDNQGQLLGQSNSGQITQKLREEFAQKKFLSPLLAIGQGPSDTPTSDAHSVLIVDESAGQRYLSLRTLLGNGWQLIALTNTDKITAQMSKRFGDITGKLLLILMSFIVVISLLLGKIGWGWKKTQRKLLNIRMSLESEIESRTIELKKSKDKTEHQYQLLFEGSNDAIFIVDKHTGNYQDANPSAERLTGRSVAELRTLSTKSITPYISEQQLFDACRSKTPKGLGEVTYVRSDGEDRQALLSIIPLDDNLLAGIARDVTDYKKAEEAIRDSEAHLRALSEGAFEAIFLSEKGICISQNSAAQELFGYRMEEAIGKSALDWIAPESHQLVRAHILSSIETRYEAVAQRKDGSTFEAEIRGKMIFYRGRQVRVTALRDISVRKQAEAKIRILSLAVEQSPAAVMITDTKGCVEYVNPSFETISGYDSHVIVGNRPEFLKSDHNAEQIYQHLLDTIKAGRTWHGELFNQRKNGSHYWASMTVSPLWNDQGDVSHYLSIQEDITAKKYAEEQFRMIATVFETTTEGIMVTNSENRIKTVNPAFTRITGYQPEEVIGKNPQLLSSGRHDAEFYKEMWLEVNERGYWSNEVWNRRKDGSVYPEWLSISAIKDESGTTNEFVAVFSDITRRKNSEQQIRKLAYHDPLTQLPNRSLLVDRLSQHIASSKRDQQQSALLFIDLDRFKTVNDTLGHEYGDELLQHVALRLKACVRESDTVARFGGDEFVILLSFIHGAKDAAHVADSILEQLSRSFRLAGREIYIGASIGITLHPTDADNTDGLLRNADLAMYRAKEAGRNCYQFFTCSLQEDAVKRMDMEQLLRQAIARNELEVHYQPLVNAQDGTIAGVEALLRWNSPEHGQVSPTEFIPLAEESGLIGPIGDWVLETACRKVKQWHNRSHRLHLAINISSRQRSLGLDANSLEKILRQTGFPSDYLILEITEGMLLEASPRTTTWLEAFKKTGVQLAIDDFGTGYSSLSYLKRFPIDTLKIDRAFVQGLPQDESDRSLVEAIIAMSRSLNLSVVAEGVETHQQREFLIERGCHYLQGYYFSKPLSAAEMTVWLERTKTDKDLSE